MRVPRLSVLALALCTVSVAAMALGRGENVIPNAGFEHNVAWRDPFNTGGPIFDDTVAHSGQRSLRLTGETLEDRHGAMLTVTFDPPIKHPLRIAGWSRAEDAEVAQDYNIYLDVFYEDDTPLWGQKVAFGRGTHDWEHGESTFGVAKPVARVEVYCLFRKAKGTVWFDDLELTLAPFAFHDLAVYPGLFGHGVGVAGGATLPASWRLALEHDAVIAHSGGDSLPIRFLTSAELPPKYTLRVTAADAYLGEMISHEQTVRQPATKAPARPYVVWTETSMLRVMPYSLPGEVPKAPVAEIALAGNEYESFQLAVLPAQDVPLRDVALECSDLVCKKAKAQIGGGHVQWHQVGYVKQDRVIPHPAARHTAPGWWPEMLLPVERFSVAPGFTQAVWVTVYAPPGTPAGHYHGTLTVRPAGLEPVEVDLRVEVYGFSLPVTGHMKTAFALMDGFLEKVYGKPLTPERRQAFGDFLLKHRLNPDDISRTSVPALEDLLHYKDVGLNAFNVVNMVEERGDRTWVCWSPLEVYTPAFKQRLIERLDPYVAALRGHGLARLAYIYTFDERGEDFFPVIREYFGMVKERYPDVHTLTTAKVPQDPAAMRGLNVDWNCPLTSVYDYEGAERCRAAGLEVWAYVCMGPRYPYANWLSDHPLVEARVIWWQAFHQKMDGLLYWGVNIWGRDNNDAPIDPGAGPLLDWSITTGGQHDWLHGDGVLVYPGKAGPIGSIRLAEIRDGLEDYEFLHRLAELGEDIDKAREACLPVTEDLTHFTREPEVVLETREGIARQVAR